MDVKGESNITALSIVVYGMVQGVGFRYFVSTEAKNKNIKGWVRNKSDGSVEIHCEGSNLDAFVQEVKRGPTFSHVKEAIQTKTTVEHYTSFDIKF